MPTGINIPVGNNYFNGTNEQILSTLTQFAGVMPSLMNPYPNLTSKVALPRFKSRPNTRTWTNDFQVPATKQSEYTERYLVPTLIRLDDQIANDDMSATWLALRDNMSPKTSLPPEILNAMVIEIRDYIAFLRDDMILNGDTTSLDPNLAHYDGLLKLWTADAAVKSVGTGAITAANAFDVLSDATEFLASQAWAKQPDIMILMSDVDYHYLTLDKEILGRDAKYADVNTQFRTFLRGNWAVIPVSAMPKNEIVITRRKNLRFGYNDMSRVFKLTNMFGGNGTFGTHDNWTRLTMGWTEAVNYTFSEEVITYGLKAAN
jgi:hypothetical protein